MPERVTADLDVYQQRTQAIAFVAVGRSIRALIEHDGIEMKPAGWRRPWWKRTGVGCRGRPGGGREEVQECRVNK